MYLNSTRKQPRSHKLLQMNMLELSLAVMKHGNLFDLKAHRCVKCDTEHKVSLTQQDTQHSDSEIKSSNDSSQLTVCLEFELMHSEKHFIRNQKTQ